ncbi:MAG TPA: HD domain-containing phosphohydrolase [Rhodocyclaceae bacterium]|nr:HD domain-containing phosphohydrolase [Rhodocyclaceae bacterium]HNH34941.1 HD domain-containing phosphohydrolase [Rhodocyclaceae bacterium]
MADIAALLNPRVRDAEALREFMTDLADLAPRIEADIARLREDPHQGELLADLFRTLHNLKGDASLCAVDAAVMIVHPVETLMARIRSGEVPFSELVAEAVLVALDRLELLVEDLAAGRPTQHLKLPELVGGLEVMGAARPEDVAGHAVRMVENVTGFKPISASARVLPREPTRRPEPAAAEDLAFFHSLALQLESRSPLFRGRTGRLLRLALDTNAAAGNPVDPQQLEAAVYVHDMGMMFVPESVWLKPGRLSPADTRIVREHPAQGAGLLGRMEGWKGAAEMVLQHHEMQDGGGYPRGLKGDEICAGAKVLAIADAYEAVVLKHRHRGAVRSLLRAAAEINACDTQFAPEWIEPFNGVIRRMGER